MTEPSLGFLVLGNGRERRGTGGGREEQTLATIRSGPGRQLEGQGWGESRCVQDVHQPSCRGRVNTWGCYNNHLVEQQCSNKGHLMYGRQGVPGGATHCISSPRVTWCLDQPRHTIKDPPTPTPDYQMTPLHLQQTIRYPLTPTPDY